MAGLWMEGFEVHQASTQLARKWATWTAANTAAGAGRVFGTSYGILSAVAVTPSLGLKDTLVFGFGLRIASQQTALNSGAQGLYLERGGTEQVHIEFVNNSGSFEIRLLRGATTLATTSSAFAYGVWHYFEVKVNVHTSTGSYEIRQNESTVSSGSGLNTANSGSNQADIFAMRFTSNVSTTVLIDDIYVLDTTGGVNDDFRGDSIVQGLLPSSNGSTIQWTNDAGAGSNFENVDDAANAAPDEAGAGGTNSSDTNGQIDLYNMQDATQVQGAVHFVQLGVQLGMSAAGSRNVKTKYRDPDTTVVDTGVTHNVNTTVFDEFTQVLDTNPNGSIPWDVSDIDGGQFGVEVTA